MREFHNPDFDSRNPIGRSNIAGVLIFLSLTFILFFGFQYAQQLKHSLPIAAVQPQAVHGEINKATLPAAASQHIPSSGNFGWLTFIARPLYLTLCLVHDRGIANWGWSIILLTAIFNLFMIWPRIMSMKSSLKMMRVQPKVEALKKRYAHLPSNDPKRAEMNSEMIALYKAEGANMFGGCLPILLQMPLLFAYMSVLRNATELHQASWLWLRDLSSPDPLHVLPLLIIGSMVLTQCITPAPGMARSQRWMFALLMPAVMGLSLWHYASGLSLYWVTCNMIGLLIQFAINRSKFGKEMHSLAATQRAMGLDASTK